MGITLGSGQFKNVASGDVASDITVNGGLLTVDGTVWGTTLNNGIEVIWQDGITHGDHINAGGAQYDFGRAYGDSIKGVHSAYAKQVVETGGYAEDTVIYQFGVQDVNGGFSDNVTVFAGGQSFVENGGATENAAIYGGGRQFVADQGTTWWTTVFENGKQVVWAGGDAEYTAVMGNNSAQMGEMYVEAGGTANSASIGWYGRQDLYGDANNTTIDGGEQAIWSGGVAVNTTVHDHGSQFVGVGGLADNTTLYANGIERVLGGGWAEGVTFGGTNAMLDLDNSNSVLDAISGFQHLDQIDLRNVMFNDHTQFNFAQGVLTVSDGLSTDMLAFNGLYSMASFSLSSDGHGGTFINGTGALVGGGFHA